MRVFILSNEDLTSNIIFANVFSIPEVEVVGVSFTKTLTKGKGSLSGLLTILKKTGLRYWMFLVFTNGFYKIFEKLVLLFNYLPKFNWPKSIRYYCKEMGIPVYLEKNFNSIEFISLLKNAKPDLLLIRIDQILKEEILAIPKLGTWCIHSSLLPSYKGIAAEFHSMNNHEEYVGSTIFKVVLELDKGPILNQKSFPIDYQKSLFYHIISNNLNAAELLKSSIKQFCQKGKIDIEEKNSFTDSYYSWPCKGMVNNYLKQGNKLITFQDAFNFIVKCLMITKRHLIEEHYSKYLLDKD